MTPRPQLPAQTDEERKLRKFVDTDLERLLRQLESDRQIFARRRFGELDRTLGRKGGFLNAVFQGKERLSLERLLATLRFLELQIGEFFARLFPQRKMPPSAVDFLLSCKEPKRSKSRIPFRQDLLTWGRQVAVSTTGATFDHDPDLLLTIQRVNSAAAYRLALAALEGVVALRPAALTRQSAQKLCRMIVPLADIMRVRGDRNSACELLDLAFRIEGRLEDPPLRAFIYRMGSYLLSDLVHLPESELFAERAVQLCLLSGDIEGLGTSLYIRGLMVWRQAYCAEASPFFEACLHYIPAERWEFRAATLIALAQALLESGDLGQASAELERAERTMRNASGTTYGKLLLGKAELSSLAGQTSSADHLFAEAAEVFAAEEDANDVAFASLKRTEHLLRHGRTQEATQLAQQLLGLANQVQQDGGATIILEVVRLALRGRLTTAVVTASISRWMRPWLYREAQRLKPENGAPARLSNLGR